MQGNEETKIVGKKLILPKRLTWILNWKYPFYRTPSLDEYSQRIIDFTKEQNRLPFYLKFDINNDGEEEIMIIQRSIFGGYGRLLIVSEVNQKFKFESIRWNRPVNSLYFDYFIDIESPKSYQTFGLMQSKKVTVNFPHIVTKGYLTRIVYWDGYRYCQERISSLNNSISVQHR
ncbi:hypothetical protein CRP01_31795 [Flavilitoribacter nigricans DSM 23189 = NBRC 102662]|uniref:Uncharacterized protein n=2 Tax=Flavilitoribacter TaxID=2762562 RepID=A0A2D0N2C2_FLAN2|nr:hypothetical protein CRP01_31795 [Flavilitoribacter nigricans DSM 23189 = NBRC 102662]